MQHRSRGSSRIAVLAGQIRRVRSARNDFLMRYAVETFLIGPLLLDPILGALKPSTSNCLQNPLKQDDKQN